MLAQVLVLFLLLIFLFLVSKKISSLIFSFFFLITRNRRFSVGILAFLLLPGTFIHEFSHFIAAILCRVQTGELTIFPTIEKSGEVKAGKLYMAKTDPFRRTFIGLAPMIIGLIMIYFIGKILLPTNLISYVSYLISSQPTTYNLQPITYLGFYLLFIVSTTMFSSKKDLESLIIAAPITFIFITALYFTGIRIVFEEPFISKTNQVLANLNYYLLISSVLDFIIYFLLALNLGLWEKVLGKKIRMSS